mgnify:CR=1 FL=1
MTDVRHTRARYRRILRFAARYMLQAWWFELFLPRIGLASLAARGRARRLQRLARNFHTLAVALGGLMIKVGQFMSSRLDVLPPEITAELDAAKSRSQDETALLQLCAVTDRGQRASPAQESAIRTLVSRLAVCKGGTNQP